MSQLDTILFSGLEPDQTMKQEITALMLATQQTVIDSLYKGGYININQRSTIYATAKLEIEKL